MGRGTFIAFEGGEGTGKSTQARRLAERLGADLTREPGGTAVGARLRELLLDPTAVLSDRTEALLIAADRAQHVAEVIEPALTAGRTVVTDRYRYSSVAYQAYGRGLPLEEVVALSDLAGAPHPDLVVLLVVPAEVRDDRLAQRVAATGSEPDRIELVGKEFHDRVEAGFVAQAEADPQRWVVLDGTGSADEVEARVWRAVQARLGLPG